MSMATASSVFEVKMAKALETVRTVLDNNRHPKYAGEVQHTYDDKYLLANFTTNTALAAQLNALQSLGLTASSLKELLAWADKRSVTLRIAGEEKCSFDKKKERKIEPTTEYVSEYKSSSGSKAKFSSKVVKHVTEYFWDFTATYEIIAFKGSNSSKDRVVLKTRTGSCKIITTTDTTPKPKVSVVPAADVQITWLLQQLSAELQWGFEINRSSSSCHTPRRNEETQAALNFFSAFSSWATKAKSLYTSRLFPVEADHGLDLSALNTNGLFVPVTMLLEDDARDHDNDTKQKDALASLSGEAVVSNVALPCGDVNKFLNKQRDSITSKEAALDTVFPLKGKLISQHEAKIVVALMHAADVSAAYSSAMDAIEGLLYNQLISAIGKIVGPKEFADYMLYHNRKLFKRDYAPQPFSYAVRRPEHSPEGNLSIDVGNGGENAPIFTCMRSSTATKPMKFPINAATNVSFLGDRFVHAFVCHQFSGSNVGSLSLVARARQFSSFILLVGRIAGADVFEPKFGIIIQNKDRILIPLLLEQIPSPKEFRDAIESLSPEQQRFAKAFRSMQLESTLFGVAVIQIKPQLEKLLNLPTDSLTKEIRLTQDLLELFIKYQIPSDLLSYDGEGPCSVKEKLEVVKGYVKAMQDMISGIKDTELKEAKQEYVYQAVTQAAPCPAPVASKPMMKYKKKAGKAFSAAPKKSAAPCSAAAPAPSPARGGSAPPPRPSPVCSAPPSVVTPSKPVAALERAAVPESVFEEPVLENKPIEQQAPSGADAEDGPEDYTRLPTLLDSQFEKLDEDNALRPTIINPGLTWQRQFQKTLLQKPEETSLGKKEQTTARDAAFDLLDALSRSGALTVDAAELHIVLAATHCFAKALVDTVVQDNVNPIEKVERSTLIIASAIQEQPVEALVREDRLAGLRETSPCLFPSA